MSSLVREMPDPLGHHAQSSSVDKRGNQEGEQAEVKVSPQILPEIVCEVPHTYVYVEAQSVLFLQF